MLIVRFSIGVEKACAKEVGAKIDDLGIVISKVKECKETDFRGVKVSMIYFDCYSPKARLEFLIDYLDDEFKEHAILSYL